MAALITSPLLDFQHSIIKRLQTQEMENRVARMSGLPECYQNTYFSLAHPYSCDALYGIYLYLTITQRDDDLSTGYVQRIMYMSGGVVAAYKQDQEKRDNVHVYDRCNFSLLEGIHLRIVTHSQTTSAVLLFY